MKNNSRAEWLHLIPFLVPLAFGGLAIKGLVDALIFNTAHRCISAQLDGRMHSGCSCLDVSTYRYPAFVQYTINMDWSILAISIVMFYGIYLVWRANRRQHQLDQR
ncbi:hypothetical protein [Paraburkholderia phosphatilytica]|uniref:hypothetical protein n=1 Tax=Paraburkholderia phosphatilytica TaxID=2282883 RepID=UPI000F5E0B80|nr:hypothetical protein [Paraburkholderia phosphatilytica]